MVTWHTILGIVCYRKSNRHIRWPLHGYSNNPRLSHMNSLKGNQYLLINYRTWKALHGSMLRTSWRFRDAYWHHTVAENLIYMDRVYHHTYSQTSNINCAFVGNTTVVLSDVVGASCVGAAPTTSSFSTSHLASMDLTKNNATWDEKHLSFGIQWALY